MEAALQVRADGHAGQAHVGRDHHAGGVGIDHAGDGDAHGRQIAGGDFALLQHVVHDFSITARTCSGPPVRGVGCRSRWRMPPDSRTNEACTFVPPTSTPRYKRSLPAAASILHGDPSCQDTSTLPPAQRMTRWSSPFSGGG